jgi:hypothetical protein
MAIPNNDSPAARPKRNLSFWLVAALVGVLSISAIATGGLPRLLVTWGVIGVCAAIYVVATGTPGWLPIPTRKIGIGVLVAGLVVTGAGSALAGPIAPSEEAQTTTRPVALASETPTPTPTPSPTVETREEVVTAEIPFAAVNRDDATLQVGTNVITVAGANGTQSTTFRVTIVDGVETSREQIAQSVTTLPIDQVTNVGTQPIPVVAPPAPVAAPAPAAPSGCDPNYSGCVPIASDVDCPGGSGNGPAYADGVVQVIGSDIYDLDRDGDGYGCD